MPHADVPCHSVAAHRGHTPDTSKGELFLPAVLPYWLLGCQMIQTQAADDGCWALSLSAMVQVRPGP